MFSSKSIVKSVNQKISEILFENSSFLNFTRRLQILKFFTKFMY